MDVEQVVIFGIAPAVIGLVVAALFRRSESPILLTTVMSAFVGSLAAFVLVTWPPLPFNPMGLVAGAFLFGPYCVFLGSICAFFGCSFQWIFQRLLGSSEFSELD